MLCRSTAVISAALYWYDITPFPTLLDKFANEEQNLFIFSPPPQKKVSNLYLI